eukprot:SAG11_NODE_372_length_10036_cov_8.820871_2_plen_80_part_00
MYLAREWKSAEVHDLRAIAVLTLDQDFFVLAHAADARRLIRALIGAKPGELRFASRVHLLAPHPKQHAATELVGGIEYD